ncbi:MAG: HD domain-containing phosphohydrolase [Raoultibacter sp.]|jgi:putative two-component system response regulator
MKSRIVLVDDSKSNLVVGKNVLSEKYEVYSVASGERFFKLLDHVTPDLILLDIEMPGMNGFEVLERLRKMKQFDDIPVIFLTGKSDPNSELDGLSLGAVDYITKPFSPPLLLKRIELHLLLQDQKKELQGFNENLQDMVEQKTQTVTELQNAIIQGVAEIVEFRDDVTGDHIENTQQYLALLLDALRENGAYADELALWESEFFLPSSQFHDVGKITVSDTILLKPGRLTDEEFDLIKEHTTKGVEIIQHIARKTDEIGFLKYAEVFAETHHERWDGKGYPRGTKELETPLPGRMMSVVDVYDALVSDRPYKKAFTHEEAMDIIAEGRGTQFDPLLVDLFLSIGDKVKASTRISINGDSSSVKRLD